MSNEIPFNKAASGISEEMIKELVHSFYAKIRQDEVLAPIFNARIGDNWEEHLQIMCNFWSGIALASGRYKGQPLPKHAALPAEMNKAQFSRWLVLFTETSHEIFPQAVAEFFIDKAHKIGNSLMIGIAFLRGKMEV